MNEEKIKQVIAKSGNDLHVEAERMLKKAGWHVTSSMYYIDSSTEKARETDIIATKDWDINDNFGKKVLTLRARLFIECKKISEPVVIWTKDKTIDAAEDLARDNNILRGEEYINYSDNIPPQIHHYLTPNKVIYQWDTIKEEQNDFLFKGVDSCLKSLLFFKHRFRNTHYVIDYPIIIIDPLSVLKERDSSKIGASPVDCNQQIELYYSYLPISGGDKTSYFLVDVVELAKLNDFQQMLRDNDIQICLNKLHFAATIKNHQRI